MIFKLPCCGQPDTTLAQNVSRHGHRILTQNQQYAAPIVQPSINTKTHASFAYKNTPRNSCSCTMCCHTKVHTDHQSYHHRNANPGQHQNQEQKSLKSLHDGKQSTIYDELKQVSTLLTQLIQNNISMNQQRIQYQMYPEAAFPPQFANTRFI